MNHGWKPVGQATNRGWAEALTIAVVGRLANNNLLWAAVSPITRYEPPLVARFPTLEVTETHGEDGWKPLMLITNRVGSRRSAYYSFVPIYYWPHLFPLE